MDLDNILVIKLRYMGDVLLATPTLHALKAASPQGRLTVAVNRGTEEVLLGNPDVDELLVLDKGPLTTQWRFVSDVRQRQFDTVVDLTDGDRSAFLSWMSGAPVRIGFNEEHRWRGLCYTEVIRPMPGVVHRIDRDLEALKPLGVPAQSNVPQLWLTREEENGADRLLDRFGIQRSQPIVVLQPGARYWFKAWPPERFAELADRLTADYGCQILIGGSQQDLGVARQIQEASKSTLVAMAGQATLKEFAAIVKRASLFVGNDSGAMHMAAALGVPLVALFGPSNPAEWGPRGARTEVLYKGLDCRRCFHPTCRRGEQSCMRLISVGEVFEAARKLLVRGSGFEVQKQPRAENLEPDRANFERRISN